MKSEQKQVIAEKQTSTTPFETKKTGGQGTSLTSKQEKFAQLVSQGKSQSDAYRGAFDAGNCSDKTIHEKASILMADGKISARVDELRAQIMSKVAEEVAYDYQDAMAEFEQVRVRALEMDKLEAANTSILNKSKLSGLMVEDRKNDRNPVSGMSHDRVKAALDVIYAMRKAKQAAAV